MVKKPVNTDDENQVRSAKKKAELERERELEEIKSILNTSAGRYFIWRVLEKCKIFHSLSGYDPQAMATGEGKRDIGLWILEEVNEADKNGYLSLVKEAQSRENDR